MTLLPPPSLHRHRLQMLEHRPRAAGVGVGVGLNELLGRNHNGAMK